MVALTPFAVFLVGTQVVGTLWFKPYRVPSGSMEPTIHIGDRILADRHDRSPHIGDVVIVHPPVGALQSRCATPRRETSKAPCGRATPGLSDIVFIKRVVAGPGDTIAFRDGLVVRNGRPVSEPYARRCTDDICELPQAVTVPRGAWFLAGDFRGESDDSRFWGRCRPRRSPGSSSTAIGRRSSPDGSEKDLCADRPSEVGSQAPPQLEGDMADESHGDFAAGERTTPQGPERDFAEGEEETVPGAPRDFAEGEEESRHLEEGDFGEGQEESSD